MGLEVKNPLRAQSKYGLMGSSAKTGKFVIGGSQERKRCTFLSPKHKSAIWHRTPPHLHIKPSLCVQEGSGVTNLQTDVTFIERFVHF